MDIVKADSEFDIKESNKKCVYCGLVEPSARTDSIRFSLLENECVEDLSLAKIEIISRHDNDAKRFSFGKVSTREYNIIPGDNPSVGMGPPLSLGWKFVDLNDLDVEDHIYRFRNERSFTRNNMRNLILNAYQRKKILFYDWGFNEEDIDLSTKLAHKVKMQRWRTQRLLRLQVFDGGMKSAKRLVKRTIMKRND